MKFALASLFALLAFSTGTLRAADDAALTALQQADDARVAATIAAHPAKLAAILSDELRYAHSTGTVDTKASFIETLTSGKLKYAQYEYQDRKFSLASPGVAVMTGRAHVKTVTDKGPADAVLAFLAVWREEDGHWRFYAWQSCKITPAPGPAK